MSPNNSNTHDNNTWPPPCRHGERRQRCRRCRRSRPIEEVYTPEELVELADGLRQAAADFEAHEDDEIDPATGFFVLDPGLQPGDWRGIARDLRRQADQLDPPQGFMLWVQIDRAPWEPAGEGASADEAWDAGNVPLLLDAADQRIAFVVLPSGQTPTAATRPDYWHESGAQEAEVQP
jgi:hypothetical protein